MHMTAACVLGPGAMQVSSMFELNSVVRSSCSSAPLASKVRDARILVLAHVDANCCASACLAKRASPVASIRSLNIAMCKRRACGLARTRGYLLCSLPAGSAFTSPSAPRHKLTCVTRTKQARRVRASAVS